MPGPREILLIDGDRQLRARIAGYLSAHGYRVTATGCGHDGIERLSSKRWEAVILDPVLPGQDGFEVIPSIRTCSDVPILVHALQRDEPTVVAALEAGADDYLGKGCSPRHLLARLRALGRRAADPARERGTGEIAVAGLRIEPGTRTVTVHGQGVALTPNEFKILHLLARARGFIKTRDDLLAEISHRAYRASDRSIDMQVSSLRRKLGDDPKHPRLIRTVRSVGYVFNRTDSA